MSTTLYLYAVEVKINQTLTSLRVKQRNWLANNR
jgi:hypothetical protein